MEKELKLKKEQMQTAINDAEEICRQREATKEEIERLKAADLKVEVYMNLYEIGRGRISKANRDFEAIHRKR